MDPQQKKKNSLGLFFYLTLTLAYTISLGLIAWYLHYTWSYLRLPYIERPFHELHAHIKPGGLWGHGLGIIGSFMMIIMHTYSLRKRLKIFSGFGSLRKWLHFHIYLGVIGPLLVMVHTTGKINGLVSVSFWAMMLVFLSGFVGRFLYGAVPRRATGLAYSLEEAIDISDNIIQTLKLKLALISGASSALDSLESRWDVKQYLNKYIKPIRHVKNLQLKDENFIRGLRPLWGFSFQFIRSFANIKTKADYSIFTQSHKTKIVQYEHYRNRIIKSIKRSASLKRKVKRWKSIQSRLHYWHIFHKPLSVLMYIVLAIHIYVAIKFGFTWIF